MSLQKFWPPADQEHAGSCIFTEAETAPDSVFLAVHRPMILLRKTYQSDEEAIPQTEIQILEEFIRENPSSGTVVMPIIGDSAVGKSHMIRWIDAHLRLSKRGENRHIVRIPKSASMKTVLRLILENLDGPEYEDLRDDLSQARLPTDSYQACLDLRSNLTGALSRLPSALQGYAKNGKISGEDNLRLSHARGLLNLLNDPGVSDYLISSDPDDKNSERALNRIVSPILNDSHDVDRERDNQFYSTDLDFVDVVEVADLAAKSRPYFNRLSRKSERESAVATLNMVQILDEALSGLIDFSGDSLPEIFNKVRQGLFKEKKELVLLVEDFAILGGIQQQLLDAVTNPVRDGQQYCVMRTAIAVTRGRLDEATVLTRAGAWWEIRSRPFTSEDDAINVFTNMVGGYLNAARHGVTELNRQLNRSASSDVKFSNHLDEFSGELTESDRKKLDSFGYSPDGNYPLFPFNRNSIHQIMERNLKVEGEYQFKPRAINRVIRETVMNYRDSWQKKLFPLATYQRFTRNKLGSEVNLYLNRTSDPERSATLLGYWGGCPATLEEASALPTEIYEAFNITPIDWGGIVPTEPKHQTPEVNTKPPTREVAEPANVSKWRDSLNEWRQEHTIGQRQAAQLRKWIAEDIEAIIDLDPLTLRNLGLELPKLILLPHAKTGNPQNLENFHLVTSTEDNLKDSDAGPRFFLTIESLIQFHERKNWDYDGAEIDCARHTNFIERLAAKVESHLRESGAGTLPNKCVSPLVHSLMIGARILNLEKASSSTYEGMIEAMLDRGPPASTTPRGKPTQWEDLQQGAALSRPEMRELLLEHIAARQGGGQVEHAVDASVLITALKELKKQDWKLGDWGDDRWRKNLTSGSEHINSLRRQLPSILERQATEAADWATKVEESIGESFNIDEVAELMRETITKALKCGAFRHQGNTDPKPLRDLISAVKQMAVKGCFDEAKAASVNEGGFGKSLSAIGKLDLGVMSKTRELLEAFEAFFSATSQDTDAKLADVPDPSEAIKRLTGQLETAQSNWKQIATQILS